VVPPDSNASVGNLQILRATNAQSQPITDAVFDSYNPSMRTNIYKIYYTFKDTSLTSATDAVDGEIWMYGPKHNSTALETEEVLEHIRSRLRRAQWQQGWVEHQFGGDKARSQGAGACRFAG